MRFFTAAWRFFRAVFAGAAVLAVGAVAMGQLPNVQVSRAGFPTAMTAGAGAVMREGQWTPVITELQLPGSGVFEGSLRIVSEDMDGDLAEFVTSPVVLNPEAGLKRYWTYAAGFERRTSASNWFVDVLDRNGAVILRQPVPQTEVLSNDAQLIVDMSEQPVNKLRMLQLRSRAGLAEGEAELAVAGGDPAAAASGQRYLHEIAVSFLPTRDVPDRWFGYEAVDCVVWDRPNPAALSEAQIEALVQWVRNGGRLVVGLGENWAAVRDSPLAAILPVKDVGSTVTAGQLRFFSQRYLGKTLSSGVPLDSGTLPSTKLEALSSGVPLDSGTPPSTKLEALSSGVPLDSGTPSEATPRGANSSTPFSFPSPIAVATVVPTADAVVTFRDQALPSATTVDLITMRCVGSGRVIATAASLRDLTTAPIDESFWREVLDVAPISDAYAKKLAEKQQGTLGLGLAKYALFGEVARQVSFQATRTVFVLAVFLFVLLYGATATLGSWWWLRRKSLTGMSWTVFAGFAIVASGLSLGAVSVTSGLRQGVQSVQVVDLEAAERSARTFGWYGYGSALRQGVDLSLGSAAGGGAAGDESTVSDNSGEAGFVRAMTMPSPTIATFATPARYEVDPAAGEARDVLIRATLKQFEGAWSGPIDGTVMGQLVADRGSGELAASSWIQNDLAATLVGGHLLYLDPRSRGGNFDKLDRAGLTTVHWRGASDYPAAMHVVSVALPTLKSGERTKADFGREQYGEVQRLLARWATDARNTDPKRTDRPDLVTLWQLQQFWANNSSFVPPGSERVALDATGRALLLASTWRWYQPNSDVKDLNTVGQLLTLEGMPLVDVTHWLVRGQALLLAWAESPGPAALVRDGQAVRARSGFTLYRVRIPIQLTGQPPAVPSEVLPVETTEQVPINAAGEGAG